MKTGAPVIIGSAAKVVGTAAGTATAGLLISTGVLAPPAPVELMYDSTGSIN